MNNTQHTPGPWHVGLKPGPIIYGSDSSQVADLRADLIDKNERDANARLMAAAPELLTALETLMARAAKDAEHYAPDGNEPIWGLIGDASDAIAKATGDYFK
jgi:hypothetical protein